MSFWKRLFGGEKTSPLNQPVKQEERVSKPIGNSMYTNAPEYWGVFDDGFMKESKAFAENYDENKAAEHIEKRSFMVNSLMLIGDIRERLEKHYNIEISSNYLDGLIQTKEAFASSICVSVLFKEGIIRTNGIIIDNKKRYAIQLFVKPVSMDLIEKMRAKYQERGFHDLVYFCISDPERFENQDEMPFVQFSTEDLRMKDDQSRDSRLHKEYAVWWTEKNDMVFSNSMTYAILKEMHKSYKNTSTYILGQLAYALKRNPEFVRVQLPDYDEVVALGPENVEMILTLSSETGINFHFPKHELYETYRDNYLRLFKNFCQEQTKSIQLSGYDMDHENIDPKWIGETEDVEDIESVSFILSDKMLKYWN